uniref:Uncharacterized protein n=1 Tax=Onchocerca volvulus TaxID=6282 RepID=A0A8R1Y1A9_ONCVO
MHISGQRKPGTTQLYASSFMKKKSNKWLINESTDLWLFGYSL